MTEDDESHTTTSEQALFKLQTKVKSSVDKIDRPISLVDDLIAMRRAEAKNKKAHKKLLF